MVDQGVPFNEPNLTMEARKRRMLSISEKMELIKLMQNSSKNKKAVAAKFGIPVNTVGTIFANRERILEKCKGNFTNMNLKRLRPSTYPDIEETLLDWYIKNHTNGHISCLTLRAKALQVAKSLGHDNFSASNGWIERFKVRHNLKFRRNKDKNIPPVSVCSSSDDTFIDTNKSDISQSGNSSETDMINRHEPNQNQLENVWNPVMELTEVKQEDTDSHSYDCESRSSLHQNGTNETAECSVSPSHIIPEVHLTETVRDNQNNLLNDSYSSIGCTASYCNSTIQNVEDAFNVIFSYVENCDDNVGEKTHLALKELKTFISKEKERKAQSKITDYFCFV